MSYLHHMRSSGGGFEENGSAVGDEETLTPHEAYEVERARTINPQYTDQQQQQENYEFQLKATEPTNDESASTAVFWTPKRKLITAICSIAIVTIAAAVGVSASSKSPSANQQPPTQDVVFEDIPSVAEDTAEPVAVEPAPELISTEIVEDGIIYDFVAQQEVSVEEPQFDLDVVEFKGDLSDFIDADVARFSIDADDESCNSEGALWEFVSITDMFPWESSWKLFRQGEKKKEVWVHGPPAKTSYNRLTNYRGQLCLPPGDYEMQILDSEGDGSCCEYGRGGYTVTVGGKLIGQSDMEQDDPFDKRTYEFSIEQPTTTTTATTTSITTPTTTTAATTTVVATEVSTTESSTPESTEEPTESPTSKPTEAPTQVPSLSPSLKPTPLPTSEPTDKPTPEAVSSDISNCRGSNVIVGIEIMTDGGGTQTGYTFTDGSDIILERATDTMSSNEKYFDQACISPGTYELIMEDTKGNGIRDPGYVAVYLGGEKILHDYRFNTSTKTYTIQAGFQPNLNDADAVWLDGHNTRRQEFHEANGKVFRPLVWSPEVAQGASDWAGKIITDGCVLSREQNLGLGELTFAMITGNENAPNAEPERVLHRWYDRHVDYTVPTLVDSDEIPGLAFSQVVWLSSRYLGCTKQVGQLPDDRYCHVVLCRYATAGNCNVNMRSNEWKTRTLADKSLCGDVCPTKGEGCH